MMSLFSNLMDRLMHKQWYKLGKVTAKRVLLDFNYLQRLSPELSKDELYYLTVLRSPGYTEESARMIVDMAKEGVERLTDVDEKFCLQTIIKRMLIYEQFDMLRAGDFSDIEAWRAIEDTIPPNL